MNRKIFLILVFSLATLYTVYNIYDTYALLETDEIVSNDIKTAKWNIKINDTLLGNTTSFVVDGINRLSKDKFVLGIYLLFYTFVLFYALTYIYFDKD